MTNTEEPPAMQERDDVEEVYRLYAEGKRVTDPDLSGGSGSDPKPPEGRSSSATACWTSPCLPSGLCVTATSNEVRA